MVGTTPQRLAWHASLQTRVTALVVAVVTCIVVGKSAFDLYSSATEREAASAYHLQVVTDMQAKALAGPLWDYNVEQVTAILNSLTRERSFIHASLVGSNGKTVAENPPANTAATPVTPQNAWSLEAASVHEDGTKRDNVGTLHVTYSRQALNEAWWHQVVLGIETTAAVSLVTLMAVLLSLRLLMRPLGTLTTAMQRLAAGDTSVAVTATDRPDEIGAMARAVDVFKTNKINADHLEAEQAAAREARSRRQDAMERDTAAFGTSVSQVMTKLAGAAEDMRSAAEQMTHASSTVHQAATSTSDGAVKSADDLATTAISVQDLTASFAEIARQVSTAAEVSRQAVQRAEANQATIRGLAESTARISDVVKLIDNIAAQTNLLALNATIEAARAGDAGKGFAVVASEVKALAAQTARATAEIAAQIDSARGVTEATVEAMHEIGAMIGRMDAVAGAIATSVEQQGETTRAISMRVQTVSDATALSAQSMGRVVEVARETGSASQKVLDGAGNIRQEATLLRDEVDRFLVLLRTDSGERRRFERFGVNGARARLLHGKNVIDVAITDLSEGGAALRCDRSIPAGSQVALEFGDAGAALPAQVVRSDGSAMAIEFPDDPAVQDRIKQVLGEHGLIGSRQNRAASGRR
jgi:methyl-accepting chemotaxis protein